MNKTDMNFIKTSDKETAEKLHSLGFIPISYDNGIHTFVNCRALTYADDIDDSKLVYSNAYFA